ncbi:YlxQ-related RNA-binding protein [Lapidilactobacillus bayanensis]|uniref:YlxQ-related RNA-binding protein n=1 Tax=Lapidilactobacillus bayanensis TaxID=2485998 RepID=UPI000F7A05AB|nr:YlxQ-related RNA-binding protein [Lapidilactobacillus bayanensis]
MTIDQAQQQKLLGLLGLAQRARQLTTGEELVVSGLSKQQIKLIFLASDTGVNTQKKIRDKANFNHIPVIEIFTTQQLTQAIGQPRKVIGINDPGFAKGMVSLMR